MAGVQGQGWGEVVEEGGQKPASLGKEMGKETAGSRGETRLSLHFRKVTLALLWLD